MGVSPPASEEARESDSKLSILVSILPSEDVCPIHSPPPKEKKPELKPEPDPQLLKILDPEDMCHVHSRFCKPEIANTATVKEKPKPDPQLLEILDPEDMCQVHCRLPKPEPAKTPVPEKPDIRNKWFTAIDVEKHNSVYDLYVSIYGKVYDLTNLITRHHHALAKPIIEEAGKDISFWFQPWTAHTQLDVIMTYHPVMRIPVYDVPQGRFIHIPPLYPCNNFDMSFETPWWIDPQYIVGNLSKRTRYVRIKNVLTDHVDLLEVPLEESIKAIMERYTLMNAHAFAYLTLAICDCVYHQGGIFKELDMDKNLGENGLEDESEDFGRLGMALEHLIPVLDIHYTDDLTVA